MGCFKWESGRQGGYEKLMLFSSKLLRIDAYLLRFKTGSRVKIHSDPAPKGFEHHRLNITIKKPRSGGQVVIQELDGGSFIHHRGRVVKFRPDIQRHEMFTVTGKMLVLSLGWMKKQ